VTIILDDIQVSCPKKGSVRVEFASLVTSSEDTVCIWVNLKNKWVELVACSEDENGVPGIVLRPNTDKDEFLTEVKFPKYRGWEIFAAQTSGYLASVCLMNKSVKEKL
jgi:hypothetical protein